MDIQTKIKRILLPQYTLSEIFIASILCILAYTFVIKDRLDILIEPIMAILLLLICLIICGYALFISKEKTNTSLLKIINLIGTIIILIISMLYVMEIIHTINLENIHYYQVFFLAYASVVIFRFILMVSLLFGTKLNLFEKILSNIIKESPYATYDKKLRPLYLLVIIFIVSIVFFYYRSNLLIALGQSFFMAIFLEDIMLFSFSKK